MLIIFHCHIGNIATAQTPATTGYNDYLVLQIHAWLSQLLINRARILQYAAGVVGYAALDFQRNAAIVKPMPWIFLLLPWLELWTLIELGSATSGLFALAYVFLTMVIGVGLIRRQGEGMMARIQQQQAQGGMLSSEWMMDDLALVGSGLLLMIPGMVTDSLAIIFAIGAARRGLARLLGIKTVRVQPTMREQGQDADSSQTIEGEFRRLDD